MIRDVDEVRLEPCRCQLDRKLHESAQRALQPTCASTASRDSQGGPNEHTLDFIDSRKVDRELLGREIHTRPIFLQQVSDDCNPRQYALQTPPRSRPEIGPQLVD
jgi:hypothetical protein